MVALWFPELKGAVSVATINSLPAVSSQQMAVIGLYLMMVAGKVYYSSLDLQLRMVCCNRLGSRCTVGYLERIRLSGSYQNLFFHMVKVHPEQDIPGYLRWEKGGLRQPVNSVNRKICS